VRVTVARGCGGQAGKAKGQGRSTRGKVMLSVVEGEQEEGINRSQAKPTTHIAFSWILSWRGTRSSTLRSERRRTKKEAGGNRQQHTHGWQSKKKRHGNRLFGMKKKRRKRKKKKTTLTRFRCGRLNVK